MVRHMREGYHGCDFASNGCICERCRQGVCLRLDLRPDEADGILISSILMTNGDLTSSMFAMHSDLISCQGSIVR